MNGRRCGNFGVALVLAGAFGLVGYGGTTAHAQAPAADCKDSAMMSEQKMDGSGMMDGEKMADPTMMSDQQMDSPEMIGDPMMDGQGMMGDQKMDGPGVMDGEKMEDPGMMGDEKMDGAMMSNMVVQARDGQCLASQPAAVQAAFMAVWGDRAGARWVEEHEAELARLRR